MFTLIKRGVENFNTSGRNDGPIAESKVAKAALPHRRRTRRCKVCHWTKESLLETGSATRGKFYGIAES